MHDECILSRFSVVDSLKNMLIELVSALTCQNMYPVDSCELHVNIYEQTHTHTHTHTYIYINVYQCFRPIKNAKGSPL